MDLRIREILVKKMYPRTGNEPASTLVGGEGGHRLIHRMSDARRLPSNKSRFIFFNENIPYTQIIFLKRPDLMIGKRMF